MKKKKISKLAKRSRRVSTTTRHADLPATVGLLQEVRLELVAEIKSVDRRVDARFSQIDARFSEIDARFSEIDARFSEIDAKFHQMDGRIELILAGIHRTQAIVEEQRSENRIVLDGLKSLMERQDRIEATMERLDRF